MTKEQRDQLAHLKSECNSPKSRLMKLSQEIEKISPAHAAKLDAVIGKLEAWQNQK